jgi:hypothetical protein
MKEPPPAPPKKAAADFLALLLLRQVLTQFEIPQDDFDRFMKVVEVELRPLCREWIVIYVAWMLLVLARATYGKQFSEDVLDDLGTSGQIAGARRNPAGAVTVLVPAS